MQKIYTLVSVSLLLSISLLSGCTNQMFYESVRESRIQECERKAEGQPRQDCLRGYEKDYDTYKEEREDIVGRPNEIKQKLVLPTEKDRSNY